MKQQFIVAFKDATRIPGKVVPGKELGHFHKKEHALIGVRKLVANGQSGLEIGIFHNGQLVSQAERNR